MLIIVKNVFKWKKIGMVVRRLLTWEVRERICFMSGRNMDLKSGDKIIYILLCI